MQFSKASCFPRILLKLRASKYQPINLYKIATRVPENKSRHKWLVVGKYSRDNLTAEVISTIYSIIRNNVKRGWQYAR